MRGGKRENAGRPKGSGKGEPTKVMRVPESRITDIQRFLQDGKNHSLPLYSCSVKAGFPSPADDYIEMHLDLNEHLIRHPAATFLLKASGDSMMDVGIHDGDLLVVDRSIEATHGRIVIAAVNGELTVRRLSCGRGKVQLLAANKKYSPIDITDHAELVIWGVVIHAIHSDFL